jgi:hypothetical protein
MVNGNSNYRRANAHVVFNQWFAKLVEKQPKEYEARVDEAEMGLIACIYRIFSKQEMS